jgi:hypothetical protein
LCGASPKDGKEAADILTCSNRTMNIIQNYGHTHLFLRKVVDLFLSGKYFSGHLKESIFQVQIYN